MMREWLQVREEKKKKKRGSIEWGYGQGKSDTAIVYYIDHISTNKELFVSKGPRAVNEVWSTLSRCKDKKRC